jgi:hypothetical protein
VRSTPAGSIKIGSPVSLFLAWVVNPLVLAALSLGCGILVERLAGFRLPAALVLPVGLAATIVVAQLLTIGSWTAQLATPVVVGLAVAGLALALPWTLRRWDPWAAAAAVGSFAAYAAPVVLSGNATFAGYVKLDDTSTFLAFTDRALEHGRSLAGLAPSSYEAALTLNVGDGGYPIGAFLPLGIGSKLTGQDPAWTYQPCLALYAALLALALYALAGAIVRSRALRAGAALVASQAAILYGYALWGGLKELAAAALIALMAALTPTGVADVVPLRRVLPFAVACAGTLAVLSVTGALFVVPFLLPLAVVLLARSRQRTLALAGGSALILVTLALSVPSLLVAADFYRLSTGNILTAGERLGNLVQPLSLLETFGIWPAGDFRFQPDDQVAARVLIAILLAGAVVGLLYAVWRRAWDFLIYPVSGLAIAVLLDYASSPWLTAKAYATASPGFVLAALVGAGALGETGRRVEGAVLATIVAGGVVWSNVLGYHDVWLAPRGQLAELERIGERYADEGPALMTEYQPYGVRHFLRDLDPEGASELRRRPVALADGSSLEKGEFADLDRFRTSDVLVYRTIVLRRSPVESRPPAPYRLASRGIFYDVWQRDEPPLVRVLEHLGLGDRLHPAGVPRCADVERLAGVAQAAGGGVVAALARNPSIVGLGTAALLPGWAANPDNANLVVPDGSGTVEDVVDVPRGGRYGVWLGGSFRRTVRISVDGRRVGSRTHQLNNADQWTPFGSIRLARGEHTVTLEYGGSALRPGSGGPDFAMGPIAFAPPDTPDATVSVEPAQARTLCGRTLDWIEAVA